MTFKVQTKLCATCIYRPDTIHDLERLENDIRDPHVGFASYRVCHHSNDVCCRGFWNEHKDEFQLGQVAQRLGVVEFVEVDVLDDKIRKLRS
jgi:hypothetical protein